MEEYEDEICVIWFVLEGELVVEWLGNELLGKGVGRRILGDVMDYLRGSWDGIRIGVSIRLDEWRNKVLGISIGIVIGEVFWIWIWSGR